MAKRNTDDAIMHTREFVIVNGKQFTPKRYSVYQAQQLLNESREKGKRIDALRIKALRLGSIAQKGNLEDIDISDTEQTKMLEEALELQSELEYEMSDLGYHFDLIRKSYPDMTEEDLEAMTEDEYEVALETIFEVNPSLKKRKEKLLQKVILMNQTT